MPLPGGSPLLVLVLAQVAQAATLSTCGTAPTSGCFPTVGDALAAAAPGDTIDLVAGTYAEQVVVTQDVELAGSGAVRWIDPADAIDGGVVEVNDAVVTITGVSFATTRVRPLLTTDADVTLVDCQLQSTAYQSEGGLVHATRGSVALYAVQLGPAIADRGGHVWATDADLVLDDVRAREGRAWDSGGSIYVRAEAAAPDVWVYGGRFEENWSYYEGAALHASGDVGRVSLENVEVFGNEANQEAVIALDGGELAMIGGSVARNVGGTVNVMWGTLSLDRVWFGDNEGSLEVGGIGALEVVDSAFVRNEGTAVHTNGGPTRIVRSVFCGNHAESGSAIALSAGESGAELWNNLFYANTADYRGGAMLLHAGNGARATLAHNDFLGNVAAHGPAIWWSANDGPGAVELINNLVAHHVATGENVPTDWTFAIASVVQEFPRLDGNLFWNNPGGDVKEWAVGPTVYADPIMPYWTGSVACPEYDTAYGGVDQVHVSWYGPARDAGVDTLDLDGTIGDIGVTGGPEAHPDHWLDRDEDGWPAVYDCWDSALTEEREQSAATHPGAHDEPYTWNDEDCDLTSDEDADKDGHDSVDYGGDDCDDADPLTYPGAPEIPHDGVDQDCDELDELDYDGDGWNVDRDCDDFDPTVNPGQVDDDTRVDRDCDGITDLEQPLRALGCDTTPGMPAAAALVAGLLAIGRRRRRGR